MARTLDDGPLSSARATRELPHRRSRPLDVPRLLAHVVLIRSSAAALTELRGRVLLVGPVADVGYHHPPLSCAVLPPLLLCLRAARGRTGTARPGARLQVALALRGSLPVLSPARTGQLASFLHR